MKNMVLVPSTIPGTPCANLPISLLPSLLQTSRYCGFFIRCRYSNCSPVSCSCYFAEHCHWKFLPCQFACDQCNWADFNCTENGFFHQTSHFSLSGGSIPRTFRHRHPWMCCFHPWRCCFHPWRYCLGSCRCWCAQIWHPWSWSCFIACSCLLTAAHPW